MASSVDYTKVKAACEDWLLTGLLCRNCGQLPDSLWSLPCLHVVCQTCKDRCKGKNCVICGLQVRGKNSTCEEHFYSSLLEAVKELVPILEIDVDVLKNQWTSAASAPAGMSRTPVKRKQASEKPKKKLKSESDPDVSPGKQRRLHKEVAPTL